MLIDVEDVALGHQTKMRWNDAADPDGDANTAYDDNPAGQAAFGLYGSQPRNFIFQRENY